MAGRRRDDRRLTPLHHLELAGPTGMTRDELLTAIGPTRTSLASIQRALVALRSDDYEAEIVYDGKTRRWRLEARVPLPLHAPDHDDVLAVLIAVAILEPLVDRALLERLTKLVEDLDELARAHTSSTNLPTRKSMTSTLTLGTRIDPKILRAILTACRRKAIRVRYTSPWQPRSDDATWHVIEPWSLRIHDGAVYLRAWTTAVQAAGTFRLANIEEVADLDTEPTAPRRTPPPDQWGDENPAFGIDYDRPNTAVIRLRGGVARWVAKVTWHPDQNDAWPIPGELLERTFDYRSCRELARRLASLLDGIESIEPAELHDEVVALVANVSRLKPPTRV